MAFVHHRNYTLEVRELSCIDMGRIFITLTQVEIDSGLYGNCVNVEKITSEHDIIQVDEPAKKVYIHRKPK